METVGQRRLWEAVLAMAVFIGVLHSGSCVHFEVKNGSTTCIMADLSVNFTVQYTSNNKEVIANFQLPGNSSVGKLSTCGQEKVAPLLVIEFGNHSLTLNFTKSSSPTNALYQVDELVFTYNLSDKVLFPGATENGTKEVSTNKSEISAKEKSVYRCDKPHFLSFGSVNLTFYDVKLEAYLSASNYSADESRCSEDFSPTTAPTSAPTHAPTTTPVPPKQPEIGKYRVNGTGGAACLLANMGLKLNLTYIKKDDKEASYVFTIDPNQINSTGSCSNDSATLLLFSDQVYLFFRFTLNVTASKFSLSQVLVNTTIADAKVPKFIEDNNTLSYLQTTEHKSYRCISKQTFFITNNFYIDTYSLQIQPFDVEGSKFGPVLECTDDQNGMLVPIIVGSALAGLVLIVLVAYLIGRKRSHAGYQTI